MQTVICESLAFNPAGSVVDHASFLNCQRWGLKSVKTVRGEFYLLVYNNFGGNIQLFWVNILPKRAGNKFTIYVAPKMFQRRKCHQGISFGGKCEEFVHQK